MAVVQELKVVRPPAKPVATAVCHSGARPSLPVMPMDSPMMRHPVTLTTSVAQGQCRGVPVELPVRWPALLLPCRWCGGRTSCRRRTAAGRPPHRILPPGQRPSPDCPRPVHHEPAPSASRRLQRPSRAAATVPDRSATPDVPGPRQLVNREDHCGEGGEGSKQPRAEAGTEPECRVRAGDPEGGEGGQDEAPGNVDAQRGPRHGSGGVRKHESQAVPELRPGEPSRGDGQPRPASQASRRVFIQLSPRVQPACGWSVCTQSADVTSSARS